MKKIKIGVWVFFWVAVSVLLGAALLQNYDYLFQTKRSMVIFFRKTPELPTVLFYLLTFVIGFIVAGTLALYKFYFINKSIKVFRATMASQAEQIEKLKSEVSSLGGGNSSDSTGLTYHDNKKGNGRVEGGGHGGSGEMSLQSDESGSKGRMIV